MIGFGRGASGMPGVTGSAGAGIVSRGASGEVFRVVAGGLGGDASCAASDGISVSEAWFDMRFVVELSMHLRYRSVGRPRFRQTAPVDDGG
ncbi:hypothetical protein BW13_09600 [Bifidobacterium sp. UTCIF-37]|nr:hypothetical protein BW13_09600 [Bifidobacterium sp. UTCIF-37]TPF87655.1 hypothetical protein BW11_09880 [Bifidobacterium sp. UTCIF-38]